MPLSTSELIYERSRLNRNIANHREMLGQIDRLGENNEGERQCIADRLVRLEKMSTDLLRQIIVCNLTPDLT